MKKKSLMLQDDPPQKKTKKQQHTISQIIAMMNKIKVKNKYITDLLWWTISLIISKTCFDERYHKLHHSFALINKKYQNYIYHRFALMNKNYFTLKLHHRFALIDKHYITDKLWWTKIVSQICFDEQIKKLKINNKLTELLWLSKTFTLRKAT